MLNIALFGTSADPPTAGHQAILQWLSEHFDWVAVWASDNPFKSHQTPLEHRGEMLRLLIEENESEQPNIGVYPELSSPRSLETVQRAKQRWPHADLTLVIGSDLVAQLPRWYHIEELLEQVNLLVIPRPGYQVSEDSLEQLRTLGAAIAIASLQPPAVSSTDYRQTFDPGTITRPVQDYIDREQLYVCQSVWQQHFSTNSYE